MHTRCRTVQSRLLFEFEMVLHFRIAATQWGVLYCSPGTPSTREAARRTGGFGQAAGVEKTPAA